MNEYWKNLLIKAAFAALYGSIAELAVVKVLDQNTIVAALISAGIRGLLAFAVTIKDEMDKKTAVGSANKKSSWLNNL